MLSYGAGFALWTALALTKVSGREEGGGVGSSLAGRKRAWGTRAGSPRSGTARGRGWELSPGVLAGLSELSPLSAGRAGAGGGMQRQPDGASRRRAERSAALGRRGPRLQLQPERALRGRGGSQLPARPCGQRHLRLHPAGPGGRNLVPPAHRAARRRRGSQHLPADR